MSAFLARALLSVAMAAAVIVPTRAAMVSPAPIAPAGIVATVANDVARACDDGEILKRIVKRFRHQVTHVPNLPDVEILDFRRIHEHRNTNATEKWPIPRRYCGARVALSDGHERDIWYLIEGGMGLATIGGDGVEFCVDGFDRWYVYNGRCRVLR